MRILEGGVLTSVLQRLGGRIVPPVPRYFFPSLLIFAVSACSVVAEPIAIETSSTSLVAQSSTTVIPTTTTTTTTAAPPTTLPGAIADNAADLAVQIIEVENAIRTDAPLDVLMPLAAIQQRAYSRLHSNPDWQPDVFDLVGPELNQIVQLHMEAKGELVKLTPTTNTELPAWDIIEPAPIEELLGYYQEAESATGAPWEYLAAINLIETRMGRIRGLSSANAAGPMQFIPTTWDIYGEGDVFDPRDSIMAAGRLLADFGAPVDMGEALWHYNPTERYVNAVTSYALIMEAEPRSFRAFWGWQVYYATTEGAIQLPVGYSQSEPIDVIEYLEDSQ